MDFKFKGEIPKGDFSFSCLCGEHTQVQLNGEDQAFDCPVCFANIAVQKEEDGWKVSFETIYQSIKHLTPDRYVTRCRITGIEGVSGTSEDFFEPAMATIAKNMVDKEVTDLILVDTKLKRVLLLRGKITPFKGWLDFKCPGWEKVDSISVLMGQ